MYHHVAGEMSAKVLWKKLEDLCVRKTAANKFFLVRKLMSMKYRDGTSIEDHVNEMTSVFNQLATINLELNDELQALILICSLPENLETFLLSVIDSAPTRWSLVASSLLSISPGAFLTDQRGRSTRREANGRGQSKFWKEIECYYCHKKGHIKKECRKLKKDKAEAGRYESDQA